MTDTFTSDAATALSGKKGTPISTGDKAQDALVRDIAGKEKQYEGTVATYEREKAGVDTEEKGYHERQDKRWDEMLKERPQPQFAPQPVPQATDPTHIWGSAAMLFATLGSLMTRQPALAALNSASAVMNAYAKGDQATFDAAMKSWKANNDNMLTQLKYETDVYNDILKDAERREGESSKEFDARRREIDANIRAASAQFHNTILPDLVTSRDINAAKQYTLSLKRQVDSAEKSAGEIEAGIEEKKAVAELQKTPKWLNATHDQRLEMLHALHEKVHPDKEMYTPEQMTAAEDRKKKNLSTSVLGKAYTASEQSMTKVNDLISRYGDQEIPGVIAQAELQDTYTRTINGGLAIRGFQAKMNTEHAGLWDKAMMAMQQLGRGGNISPRMARDMIEIIKQVNAATQKEYWHAIQREQGSAKRQGLNADNVMPDDFDAGSVPSPPSDQQIKKLKAHPEKRADWDAKYPWYPSDLYLNQPSAQ